MDNNPILEIKDLSVSIGKKIIHPISFSLDKNERLGIIGESGSGKTVTMMALSDLLPENAIVEGELLVDGVNIRAMRQKERRLFLGSRISIIFQDSINALNPYEKIGKQMSYSIKRHHRLCGGQALDFAKTKLAEIGLDDPKILDHYPHQLSGGMRQKVFIALSLSSDPKLIIADEPTTSLDTVSQMQFIRLIRSISEQKGLPLIFISHNLGLVSRLCDRILVLDSGRIVEQGATREIIESPKHPTTKKLVAETIRLFEGA